jgi:hypothetical protein
MTDHDVLARLTLDYAFFNDTFRVDDLVALFLPEATFDMSSAGLGWHQGAARIRDFFEREARAVSGLIHLTTNHRFDVVSAHEATGTVYYHAVAEMARDGATHHAYGYYDDIYRRTSAGWRFASRRACPLVG